MYCYFRGTLGAGSPQPFQGIDTRNRSNGDEPVGAGDSGSWASGCQRLVISAAERPRAAREAAAKWAWAAPGALLLRAAGGSGAPSSSQHRSASSCRAPSVAAKREMRAVAN
jgi:hypothetical protein